MIYQCYFKEEHKSQLFQSPLYKGFGLEPEVNSDIAKNCPELLDKKNRIQLCEFGAMLHLWRNPPDDGHNWIGFTSYRQLDKSPIVFYDKQLIDNILEEYQMIAWFRLAFGKPILTVLRQMVRQRNWNVKYRIKEYRGGKRLKWGVSLAHQAETHHPGIMAYIKSALPDEDIGLFWKRTDDFYADYWIMKKELFSEFMNWIYPFIADGLKNMNTHSFLKINQRSPLGCALERLFIFWRNRYKIKTFDATNGLSKGFITTWCKTPGIPDRFGPRNLTPTQ